MNFADEFPVLPASEWQSREMAHLSRAQAFTIPARRRKDRGEPHPIEDFLFQYYPFPLALLESWHPGYGSMLEDAAPLVAEGRFSSRHYTCLDNAAFADPALLSDKEIIRIGWIRDLLAATASRPGNFSCHGLHEWAMVYQGHTVRHEKTTPLRLPQSQIDALVESRPIGCSHHDAFRFFATAARPMNRLRPSLETRSQFEQPGCVHANMDLYKWTAKTMPFSGSDLLLDCFELAMELRDLDMRASPYDLTKWGRSPVRIETPEGRREYEQEQKRLAEKAAHLRANLIRQLDAALSAVQSPCQRSF